jgi:hypothetical protein
MENKEKVKVRIKAHKAVLYAKSLDPEKRNVYFLPGVSTLSWLKEQTEPDMVEILRDLTQVEYEAFIAYFDSVTEEFCGKEEALDAARGFTKFYNSLRTEGYDIYETGVEGIF